MIEILDLWYQYEPEISNIAIIYYEDINGKEWELAHIKINNEIEQEDLYNYCLEIANEMGYQLVGYLELEESQK